MERKRPVKDKSVLACIGRHHRTTEVGISIRALASKFRVTPGTMRERIARLVRDGYIEALEDNGFKLTEKGRNGEGQPQVAPPAEQG